MLNYSHITEVGLVPEPLTYPSTTKSITELEELLASNAVTVHLGSSLKGGVVSQVYGGVEAKRPVVVKYTCDTHDLDPTNYFMPHETHFIDNELLAYFGQHKCIRVPKLYHTFKTVPLSVMEDLRDSGFELLSQQLLDGRIPVASGPQFGRDIAAMQLALAEHVPMRTALSGPQLYYSRGQELRQAYHGNEAHYERLFKRFTTANQQLAVVDTHPKNSFTNQDNNVAWIDFGCSAWCDRDFALPNFLAHIVIYCLTGHISVNDGLAFVRGAIGGYKKLLPLDEEVFCEYLAAEVIHRWSGKWIDGVKRLDQKLRLLTFGMTVFDTKCSTVEEVAQLLQDMVGERAND